ncbi:MAG TPA: WYL domain-containing protein, partial [Roseomonas sp.]
VCDDDSRFADAAEALLQRINDALPPPAGTGTPAKRGEPPLRTTIRRAIDAEEALWLRYADKGGRASERTVWPIAFSILGSEELVAAWCESRADFRHFRLDRIVAAEPTGRRYPRRQRLLLAAWQRQLDEDGMG